MRFLFQTKSSTFYGIFACKVAFFLFTLALSLIDLEALTSSILFIIAIQFIQCNRGKLEEYKMNHKDRMEKGLWYDANFDQELCQLRSKADDLCFQFNHIKPSQQHSLQKILKQLFPNLGQNVTLLGPMYADYGFRTSIGDDTFINHDAYFMDGGKITIGRNCFIGPHCGLYTANHPLLFEERNQGYEIALPIVIEDNVWIGADVTILPGVTIGEGSVIGAKSLVNKDIPPHVIAVGNPCHVLRKITKDDSIFDVCDL